MKTALLFCLLASAGAHARTPTNRCDARMQRALIRASLSQNYAIGHVLEAISNGCPEYPSLQRIARIAWREGLRSARRRDDALVQLSAFELPECSEAPRAARITQLSPFCVRRTQLEFWVRLEQADTIRPGPFLFLGLIREQVYKGNTRDEGFEMLTRSFMRGAYLEGALWNETAAAAERSKRIHGG